MLCLKSLPLLGICLPPILLSSPILYRRLVLYNAAGFDAFDANHVFPEGRHHTVVTKRLKYPTHACHPCVAAETRRSRTPHPAHAPPHPTPNLVERKELSMNENGAPPRVRGRRATSRQSTGCHERHSQKVTLDSHGAVPCSPFTLLQHEAAANYRPPMHMYFTSRYSSMPFGPPSRPRPDCLIPPNGATSVEITPSLTPTMPTSNFSATRQTRPMSRL